MRRGEVVRCERLVAPSAAAFPQEPTPELVADLRALFASSDLPPASGERVLYIQRAGRRRVMNEAALVEALDRQGVRAVDLAQLKLEHQISLLSGARIVIAPHGAGIANIVHSEPGGMLIELLPGRLRDPCFYLLAGACGLGYANVAPAGTPASSRSEADDNFSVDVDAVIAAVREAKRLQGFES
jgi:capsular polysaccharide biosynthesis protein